jgi:hypothetical protein
MSQPKINKRSKLGLTLKRLAGLAGRHVVIPFFAAFGMALILYGIVLGIETPSKFWFVVQGFGVLLLVYLLPVLFTSKVKRERLKGSHLDI